MANKNQVTLTFAGDSKSLERTFSKVGSGAEKAETDLDRVSGGATRLHKAIGTGGRQFGDYGKGLGGVGDRADEVDTRMMGLSDGIQGVTDLMGGNGKLRPHEMAMAFSDLGSAAYNTVIPSLQSAGKGVQSLATQFGGLKTAALATGAALGAAGLVLALKQYNDAADEARGKDLAEHFERTGEAAEEMRAAAEGDAFAMGDMANAFDHLLDKSPVLAQQFLDQAEAAGLDAEKVETAQAAIDAVADSSDRAAESISNLNDQFRAQTDPIFGAIDAANSLSEAQAAAAEATAEHGASSREAKDAAVAAASAAADYDSALLDLQAAVESGDVSIGSMGLTLSRWVSQGVITEAQADAVRGAIERQTAAAEATPGRVDTTLYAHDRASGVISNVGSFLRNLDGRSATVNVTALTNFGRSIGSLFAASGGIAPQYLASGGLGGPKGTDTIPAWLTPGEMILNKGQQSKLFELLNGRRMAGGGIANPFSPFVREGESFNAMLRRYAGSSPFIRHGSVPEAMWRAFRRYGWRGRPGDGMEALWLADRPMDLNSSKRFRWATGGGARPRVGTSGSIGGDAAIVINIYGSLLTTERELKRMIRDEFQRGGFAGLLR